MSLVLKASFESLLNGDTSPFIMLSNLVVFCGLTSF